MHRVIARSNVEEPPYMQRICIANSDVMHSWLPHPLFDNYSSTMFVASHAVTCTCIVYVLVYSHVLIFFCILFFLFLYIAYCTDINSSVFKYLSSSASNTFFARLYLLSLLRIKFKNKIFVEIIMNHFIFV